MTSQPPSRDSQPAADKAAADAQLYLRILHELLEIGTQVARTVGAQAKARTEAPAPPDSEPAPAPDLTIPFDRVARAIRRTIVLARKLAEPLPAQAATPAGQRIAARKRIIREVEDVIQRTTRNEAAESLHAELADRLDSAELDEDIDHRPVAEIIADICRDLGIAHVPGTHPWKRRTPADIAELCARAAQPPAARQPAPAGQVAPPGRQPGSDPPPGRAEAGATLLDGTARFRGS